MTSLEVGTLVGRLIFDDSQFSAVYTRTLARLRELAGGAEKSAAGFTTLDDSLAMTAASADKAGAALSRVQGASVKAAGAEDKAATASTAHADALARVNALLAQYSSESPRVQAAVLRQAAAEERLAAVRADESATTKQLATAQAGLITSQRGVGAAMAASTASQNRFGFSLASTLKMAGSLGLVFGGFELLKKAIDIGKEAADYQRSMTMVQNLTHASAGEVQHMSKALLGMSGKVAQAPSELAIAFYHAASVGLPAAKALSAVRDAAEAAGIGGANLEDTMNALTAVVASGIGKNQSYAKSMSEILTIVGAGDMKLTDFNSSLSSGVLAVVSQYGVTLRDFGAAMAVFGDQNIRGTHAATMFRMTVQALANPLSSASGELDTLGLHMDTLNKDMQRGGLYAALSDLKKHLDAAGISGNQLGSVLTEIVGKRAGAGLAVLMSKMNDSVGNILSKYAALDDKSRSLGSRWALFTQTASYQFKSLGATIDAAGISLLGNLTPHLGEVATLLTGSVHAGITIVSGALAPFEAAWHAVADILGPLAGALHGVSADLGPFAHVLEGTASAVLAMWAAFKGYEIVKGILKGLDVLVGTYVVQPMIRAQLAVSGLGASFGTAAVESEASATAIAGSADAASGAVVGAADAAKIGWASIAGPIALAAVGIMTVVSLFHSSTSASKEATDAAKAYADALKPGGGTSIVGAIVKELADNNVPETLKSLNDALGRSAFTGGQFVTAIQRGGPALTALRARLQAVITSGTKLGTTLGANGSRAGLSGTMSHYLTPAAQAATKALGDLNAQHGALTSAAAKELADFKSVGAVASSVAKVGQSLQLGSKTATQYALMMGFVADSNNIVQGSAAKVRAAIDTVKVSYANATVTERGFLDALQTFSNTAGTAADRAALIGATLKAANGDTLSYETTINAAAGAVKQLGSDIRSAANADQAATKARDAYNKAAGKYATVAGANAVATAASSKAVKDYLGNVVNLTNGTINYHRAAAAPLLNDLNSLQSAAMASAQAEFQHQKGIVGSAQAAAQAYQIYRNQTSGALIDEATKLGLTQAQAKKLSDTYFGMPKNVKTAIVAEGTDPILTVLNKIGKLLADFTGQKWNIGISMDTREALAQVRDLNTAMAELHNHILSDAGYVNVRHALRIPGNASGGTVPEGISMTGERGRELLVKHGNRVDVVSNAPTEAFMRTSRATVRGFAGGSGGSIRALANQYHDWNPSVMAAIAMAESGGNATAHNPVPPDDSYGLWQINMIGNEGPARRREFGIRSDAALYNPSTNVRAAHMIWRDQGYGAWSTYNDGAYQAFLGDAGTIHSGGSGGTGGGGTKLTPQQRRHRHRLSVHRAVHQAQAAYRSQHEPNRIIAQGGQFFVNGQSYGSRPAAEEALREQRLTQERTDATAFAKELRTLPHSLDSVKNANAALRPILAELRRVGLAPRELRELDREQTHLDKLIRTRNRQTKAMQAEHAAWRAAIQHMHQEARGFTQAGRSGFDITTAGQDANGKFAGGRLLARQAQYINVLRRLYPAFHKIVPIFDKTATGRAMLRQLASEDPTQALAEVLALANSPRLDKLLLRGQAQEAQLTGQFGHYLSRRLDLPTVQRDHAAYEADKRAEKRTEHLIDHATARLEKGLARAYNEANRHETFDLRYIHGQWRGTRVDEKQHKKHRHVRAGS